MTTTDPEFIAHMRRVHEEESNRLPMIGLLIMWGAMVFSFAAGYFVGVM